MYFEEETYQYQPWQLHWLPSLGTWHTSYQLLKSLPETETKTPLSQNSLVLYEISIETRGSDREPTRGAISIALDRV